MEPTMVIRVASFSDSGRFLLSWFVVLGYPFDLPHAPPGSLFFTCAMTHEHGAMSP